MTAGPDVDVAALGRDIHGEKIAAIQQCDYCGGPLDTRRAVLYEVIRVVDVPSLAPPFAPPLIWIPDAARCPDCLCSSIHPATMGYDEALVRLSLTHSNGVFSIDGSSVTLVAASPSSEGTRSPPIAYEFIFRYADFGLPRWIRIQRIFESSNTNSILTHVREAVEHAREVPPEIH